MELDIELMEVQEGVVVGCIDATFIAGGGDGTIETGRPWAVLPTTASEDTFNFFLRSLQDVQLNADLGTDGKGFSLKNVLQHA